MLSPTKCAVLPVSEVESEYNMSMVYSKLKGRKLVKYVANATGLEQKECEEILETFVQG